MRTKILYSGKDINILGPDYFEEGVTRKALDVSDDMDEDGRDSFAVLVPNSDDDGWTFRCDASRNKLIDLRRISGNSYEHWRDAIPEIECAAQGPFDLNLPTYGHLANLYEQAAALVRVGLFIDDELQSILDSIGWSYLEFLVIKSINKTVMSDSFNEHKLGPLVKFLVYVKYLDGKESDYTRETLYSAVMSWVRSTDMNMCADMVCTAFRDVSYHLMNAYRKNEVYCLGYDAND